MRGVSACERACTHHAGPEQDRTRERCPQGASGQRAPQQTQPCEGQGARHGPRPPALLPPGRLRRRPGTGVPRGKGGTCVWPKGGSLTRPSLTPCDPVGGASHPPAGHAPRHCSPRFCPPTGLGRLRQRTAGESGACWGGGGECGPWPWRASGGPPPFLVSRRRNALESRFCFHVSLGLRGHLGSRLSLRSAVTDGICSRGGLRGAPQLTGPKRQAGEVPSGVSAAGLGPRRPLAGACHACGVLSCPAA